jgi:hypothetical protein
MGSKRVLRWASVHDGEMRRSEEELGELTSRGTSATLCRDMLALEELMERPTKKDDAVGASAQWFDAAQNKVC